ncbi:hypothetical protein VTN00DRAFT_4429 [Thermoascus crustaceus]|uniref:uncharacterized protein n=1 Tax=Thermoascus crustaceus TaxID=5088 RepID=UPI0037443E9F
MSSTVIPDEAPPPYAAVDPLLSQADNSSSSNGDVSTIVPQRPIQLPLRLRGGEAPAYDTITPFDGSSSSVSGEQEQLPSSSPSIISPVNFASAAGFFEERPPPPIVDQDEVEILQHQMTIYPRSQAKDFPRRPRCWNPRADGTETEITQQDWDTFLNFLFPPHLGPAASSAHLPRRVRAEVARDRKDRPQETDEEREARIAAVIAEWNQGFFLPRGTCISWVYVKNLEATPASPLCPRCYPAATKATQVSRNRGQARSGSESLEEQEQVPRSVPVESERLRRSSINEQTNSSQSVGPQGPSESSTSATNFPPFKPFTPWSLLHGGPNINGPTPPKHFSWGWPSQSPGLPRGPPSCAGPPWRGMGSSPFSWMSQLGARAQEYGEWISEQAQQYGRLAEEHARAQGQWVEQQAEYHGRQIEQMADSLSNLNLNNISSSTTTSSGSSCAWSSDSRSARRSRRNNTNSRNNRPRGSSTSSTSSDSSLSSIDSISTTSDLDATDLATVRAELLSLDDYHHRDLHAAAVALRHKLEDLQQSRRRARFNNGGCGGRGFGGRSWGGWGPHYHFHSGFGRGRGWWESPDQGQRNERVKDEMRAVKKAFKNVVRRARREEREIRRRRSRAEREERRRGKRNTTSLESGNNPDADAATARGRDVRSSDVHPPVLTPSSTVSSASDTTTSPPSSNMSISSTSSCCSNKDSPSKAHEDAQKRPAKEAQKLAKEQRKGEDRLRREEERKARHASRRSTNNATCGIGAQECGRSGAWGESGSGGGDQAGDGA